MSKPNDERKKRHKVAGWFMLLGAMLIGAGSGYLMYYSVEQLKQNKDVTKSANTDDNNTKPTITNDNKSSVALSTYNANVVWTGKEDSSYNLIYDLDTTITATPKNISNITGYKWYVTLNGAINTKTVYSTNNTLTYSDIKDALNLGATQFVCEITSGNQVYTSDPVSINDYLSLNSDLSTFAKVTANLNSSYIYCYSSLNNLFATSLKTSYAASSSFETLLNKYDLHFAVKEDIVGGSGWSSFFNATYDAATDTYNVVGNFSEKYITEVLGNSTTGKLTQLIGYPMILNSSNQVVSAGVNMYSSLIDISFLDFLSLDTLETQPLFTNVNNGIFYYGLGKNYFVDLQFGRQSITLNYVLKNNDKTLVNNSWTYSSTSDNSGIVDQTSLNVTGTVDITLNFQASYDAFLTSSNPDGTKTLDYSYSVNVE